MPGSKSLILFITIPLFVAAGAGVSLPVHDTDTWNDGTFTNTTVSGGALELVGTNNTGTYQSRTFDTGDAYRYDELRVDTELNGGSAAVTVETSDNAFSSVQNRSTVTVTGGTESFDLSGLFPARFVRFNYSLTRGTSSPAVDSTNITLADGLHFLIRDRGCQPDEEELFSMSNRTNAHAANPGYYEQYSVCASGINHSDYDGVCVGGETPVLSFFGSQENFTHLSTDNEYFEYKLCTGQLSIGIRDTCPDTTRNIVSIYELPESHIAEPEYYQHQLCGAVFKEVSLLMQFHLGGDDTVTYNGTEDPDERTYENADGWESSIISAENGSMVAGIVSGEGTETTAVTYAEQGADHVFDVVQQRGRISYFVPFTQGSSFTLERRRGLIEQQEFLSQINPNFAYELAEEMLISLTLQLTQVDLVTDMVLASGAHRLIIENLGTNAQGEPRVAVNVTAR